MSRALRSVLALFGLALVGWGTRVAAGVALGGCALALGQGSTACVDLDSRTGLVVDNGASAPQRMPPVAGGGISCKSG